MAMRNDRGRLTTSPALPQSSMPRPGSVKTPPWAWEFNLPADFALMLVVLGLWAVTGGPLPEWLPQVLGAHTGASGHPVPLVSIRRG